MTARVVAPPHGDVWKVARVDTISRHIPPERLKALFAWLASLGIPHTEYIPELVITENAEDKRLLLHLSRHVRDVYGEKYIDHAANRFHTEPVAFVITDYPAWLVEVSQQQEKEREARHVGASSGQ